MRWLRRRMTRHSREEATRAREAAEAELERTRAETETYFELAVDLREMREQNHFAQAIGRAFRPEGT